MLFDEISEGIKEAMKAKDAVRRDTLRNVKKVFLEAKTAPGANDELSDADALKILQKLAKQGRESAEIFSQQGRADLADAEMAQVKVLEEYLPKQLSEAELEAALRDIIAQLGVTSAREMGKVMGVATKQLAGKADGKAISATVKRLLA
ncbi:MAG: GatB/YqeY domain-containing protein [Bacteroidaceae bacterium]|nr:GatB/YqeY domain-containing protein [Bacteroidaceae bacterium]